MNDLTIFISTHALREEGDLFSRASASSAVIFLPTPSARRATRAAALQRLHAADFYPRPPRGGRPRCKRLAQRPISFLPTPSARRATIILPVKNHKFVDFYPRPPRGGRPRFRERQQH